MQKQELAAMIDHTALKADLTNQQIEKLCDEARQFRFASVCIPPYYLELAKEYLNNDQHVKLCTVIGFPLGYESTSSKVFALEAAIASGADELDVVINVAAVKNGAWEYINEELNQLTKTCHSSGKTIKIIFETCYLSDDQIEKLGILCAQNEVDYVKTSTGFGTAGATVHHIGLMKKVVDGKCRIKASGGIRNWKDAEQMILAGADRIGASASVNIVNEFDPSQR